VDGLGGSPTEEARSNAARFGYEVSAEPLEIVWTSRKLPAVVIPIGA
jgi:hypothetical protein